MTRDPVDKEARKERSAGAGERQERHRTSRDPREEHGARSEPRNINESNGIYSSDSPRRAAIKNNLPQPQSEANRRPQSGLATSNGRFMC